MNGGRLQMNRKEEYYNRSYEKMAEKTNRRIQKEEYNLCILNLFIIAALALISFSVTMTIL